MKTATEIREEMYRYNYERFPYIKDWKKNPYTWFKAKLYMEAGTILVFFLLKTKIRPNTITIAYGLLGLIGGVLLAIPIKQTILIAILIFFSKGILDWSDGHLARIRGQTSITGDILDPYGALLGTLGLQMGLGFYVAQKSGMMIFYYLIPLISLFYAGKLNSFAVNVLFKEYITPERIRDYISGKAHVSENDRKLTDKALSRYSKVQRLISKFLDDRARTVDFICLLILLELFTPIFITWIIFCLFIIKHFLLFSGSLYVIAKGGWAEKQLENKMEETAKAFKP